MICLIFTIILAFIIEIYLFLIDCCGRLQLQKYDKENSKLKFDSIDEFIFEAQKISNIKIQSTDSLLNTANIIYKRIKHTIKIEDGIAFVEYDKKGYGLKISLLARTLGMINIIKTAKKAFFINSVMDQISENNNSQNKKEYKKFKRKTKTVIVLILVAVICLIIGLISLTDDKHDEAIYRVKNTVFQEDITYGEILEKYLETAEWNASNNIESETAVVEVQGTSIENENILIQFTGDLRSGFNNVDNQDFKLYYFEINNTQVEPEATFEYLFQDYFIQNNSEKDSEEQKIETKTSDNISADSTTSKVSEKRLLASFVQVGLQNHDEYSYLNKEYIPTIYLYDDNTFEFICNMYEYINTYTGSWMVTEDEALAEYRFMVENEPAIKNLDFYIMHNKSRCDAEFYTDYNEPMIYGMTSAEYENILFHFNE